MYIKGVDPLKVWRVDKLEVKVFHTREEMARAAAQEAAEEIMQLLSVKQTVNIAFAAVPSQNEFLDFLVDYKGIDWTRVTAFHLDEYIGLPCHAPQKFSCYLRKKVFSRVPVGRVYYIDNGRTRSPDEMCDRYSRLLKEHPLDIVFLGIGENGHIAFNDPHVADFKDETLVKVVSLDQASREQQVHDGCFPRLSDVPSHAITMTIPAIMAAKRIICVVPGPRKQRAVAQTLLGPITTKCPASVLRQHPRATLYLDAEAAALVLGRE